MNGATEETRGVGRGELESRLIKDVAKQLAASGRQLGNHLMLNGGHPGIVLYDSTGTYLLTAEKVSSAVIHAAENDGYERTNAQPIGE